LFGKNYSFILMIYVKLNDEYFIHIYITCLTVILFFNFKLWLLGSFMFQNYRILTIEPFFTTTVILSSDINKNSIKRKSREEI